MDLTNQRRMAAEILKCGENRVWIDPERMEDVADAVTRRDIRNLIKTRAILKKQKKGISSGRLKHRKKQLKKGRQRGPGSRKGAKYARRPRKEVWMGTIRPIRRELKHLRDEGYIDASTYRQYYRHAKGNLYRNRAHLLSHIKAEGVLIKPLEEGK